MATSFYLGNRPDKSGDLPIIVSASVRGQRLITSIGYSIAPDKWDRSRQEVKKGCWNSRKVSYSVINARIKAISSAVLDFEITTKERPARSRLVGVVAGVKGERRKADCSRTMAQYLDEFIIERSEHSQWSYETIMSARTFKGHILKYAPSSIEALDGNGVEKFITYLRNDCQMREASVEKNWSYLRYFIRWMHDKGYYKPTPLVGVNPKFKMIPKTVVFLDADELDRLFNLELPEIGQIVHLQGNAGPEYKMTEMRRSALLRDRDIFCFCCATSLRYSDAKLLRKTDIQDGEIRITTKKVGKPIAIPLNPISSAILEKYADYRGPKGAALPIISKARMNENLHIICELAKIDAPVSFTYFQGGERRDEVGPKWKYISTHAARRTFICYALSRGIPPQIVMKWTGHSNYASMKPYIDIAGSDSAKAMGALFSEQNK